MTSVATAIAEVVALLESLEIPFVVGGSFASAAWGQYRFTQDLDIAALLSPDLVNDFVLFAEPEFLIDRVEVENALASSEEYRAFQMIHMHTMFKVDCFVPLNLDAVRDEFARAVRLELVPGVVAPCLSAEDIVIRKLRWFEFGNRISDRQWNDVVQVLEMQAGMLDEAYLNAVAERHGIRALLNEARAGRGPSLGR